MNTRATEYVSRVNSRRTGCGEGRATRLLALTCLALLTGCHGGPSEPRVGSITRKPWGTYEYLGRVDGYETWRRCWMWNRWDVIVVLVPPGEQVDERRLCRRVKREIQTQHPNAEPHHVNVWHLRSYKRQGR